MSDTPAYEEFGADPECPFVVVARITTPSPESSGSVDVGGEPAHRERSAGVGAGGPAVPAVRVTLLATS